VHHHPDRSLDKKRALKLVLARQNCSCHHDLDWQKGLAHQHLNYWFLGMLVLNFLPTHPMHHVEYVEPAQFPGHLSVDFQACKQINRHQANIVGSGGAKSFYIYLYIACTAEKAVGLLEKAICDGDVLKIFTSH